MGLGAVRELLADGRPALDGTSLLEWPHNEFVRLLRRGRTARAAVRGPAAGDAGASRDPRARGIEPDPVLRALILVIAADLVAEACLQNLLNAVYHATVLILILCLAVAVTRQQQEPRRG